MMVGAVVYFLHRNVRVVVPLVLSGVLGLSLGLVLMALTKLLVA